MSSLHVLLTLPSPPPLDHLWPPLRPPLPGMVDIQASDHQASTRMGISTDRQVRGSEACAQSPGEGRGQPRRKTPPQAGRD